MLQQHCLRLNSVLTITFCQTQPATSSASEPRDHLKSCCAEQYFTRSLGLSLVLCSTIVFQVTQLKQLFEVCSDSLPTHVLLWNGLHSASEQWNLVMVCTIDYQYYGSAITSHSATCTDVMGTRALLLDLCAPWPGMNPYRHIHSRAVSKLTSGQDRPTGLMMCTQFRKNSFPAM